VGITGGAYAHQRPHAGALAHHDRGHEGEEIASGDVIAEIETDKATMEVEAVDEGKLGKILVDEGTEGVAVNSIIAVILEEGEDASALSGEAPPAPQAPAAKASVPETEAVPADPEWSGATVTQTVREALRDAMAEEMRADPKVFLMGEEVAQYQGAYKISQGLLDEFGAKRVSRSLSS
jgi:pyruvate dehydrogenase E1 component beta subunit